MRTVAAVCLTALLAACTPGSVEQPRRTTAAHGAVRAAQSQAPMTTLESNYCEPPRTFLEVGGQSVFISSSWHQPRRVTIRVGDAIRLRATGNCAKTVSAYPQNTRLRVVEEPGYPEAGARYYQAVRPGVVRLVISMPMCALPSNSTAQRCNGGIRQMGTALVTVRPAAN